MKLNKSEQQVIAVINGTHPAKFLRSKLGQNAVASLSTKGVISYNHSKMKLEINDNISFIKNKEGIAFSFYRR
jgi:hypothetical protein